MFAVLSVSPTVNCKVFAARVFEEKEDLTHEPQWLKKIQVWVVW